MVLNCGHFASQGTAGDAWRHFWLPQLGAVCSNLDFKQLKLDSLRTQGAPIQANGWPAHWTEARDFRLVTVNRSSQKQTDMKLSCKAYS